MKVRMELVGGYEVAERVAGLVKSLLDVACERQETWRSVLTKKAECWVLEMEAPFNGEAQPAPGDEAKTPFDLLKKYLGGRLPVRDSEAAVVFVAGNPGATAGKWQRYAAGEYGMALVAAQRALGEAEREGFVKRVGTGDALSDEYYVTEKGQAVVERIDAEAARLRKWGK